MYWNNHTSFRQLRSHLNGIFQSTTYHRVGFLSQGGKLPVSHEIVMIIFHDCFSGLAPAFPGCCIAGSRNRPQPHCTLLHSAGNSLPKRLMLFSRHLPFAWRMPHTYFLFSFFELLMVCIFLSGYLFMYLPA